MTTADYSDDEIHRLLLRVLGEPQSTPIPTSKPKPRPNSGQGIRRELSFDEILQKVQREIADG